MNRLGISVERGGGAGAAHPRRKPRHHAADEPPRLRRAAGASAQRPADPAVPRSAHRSIAASPPRSPIRPAFSSAPPPIATWCARASRSTASIRRPGQQQSDAAGDRIAGAHRAGAQRAARRDRRLRRRLDRQARDPASRWSRSAMPTAICARASASDEAPGADAIVAGKRCPLAGRVSMDLLAIDVTDLPDGAARRGDLATLIGDEIDRRRRRRRRRHHRLRGADQPRPALSPGLSDGLTASGRSPAN